MHSGNDFLDGINSRSAVDQTNSSDIMHYTNIRLAYNLGSSDKRTEPLYWLNPLDATFNDIAELKRRPILDLTDEDGDGVIDMIDQELGSPAGYSVDTRGVTLDSDRDGLADGKDKEIFSPPGFEVDSDGVAIVPTYMSETDVNRIVDAKTAAMSEAIANGVYDTSGYSQQPGETLDEFRALLMREYLYLLIYAEWNLITTYISGGTLSPEWTANNPSDVATNNPLGHALYTNFISKLLVKPDTTVLDSIFALPNNLSGYVPFEIDPSGGNVDCLSIIYRSSQSITSNPTWGTAKFINDGKVLPPMTWAMFVYDKCRIVGKDAPKWIISNTTNSSVADIYFESKYLTYLFKNPGKYMITLELTDTNGNKYKKNRNILVIK